MLQIVIILLLVKSCLMVSELQPLECSHHYAGNGRHATTGQIHVRMAAKGNSHHCAVNGHHSIVGQWRDIASGWQPLELCHHSALNGQHSINKHTISDCVAMPGPVVDQQNATDGNDEACWHLYICYQNAVAWFSMAPNNYLRGAAAAARNRDSIRDMDMFNIYQ
jgi:hypothetical protein